MQKPLIVYAQDREVQVKRLATMLQTEGVLFKMVTVDKLTDPQTQEEYNDSTAIMPVLSPGLAEMQFDSILRRACSDARSNLRLVVPLNFYLADKRRFPLLPGDRTLHAEVCSYRTYDLLEDYPFTYGTEWEECKKFLQS